MTKKIVIEVPDSLVEEIGVDLKKYLEENYEEYNVTGSFNKDGASIYMEDEREDLDDYYDWIYDEEEDSDISFEYYDDEYFGD